MAYKEHLQYWESKGVANQDIAAYPPTDPAEIAAASDDCDCADERDPSTGRKVKGKHKKNHPNGAKFGQREIVQDTFEDVMDGEDLIGIRKIRKFAFVEDYLREGDPTHHEDETITVQDLNPAEAAAELAEREAHKE